MEKTKHIIKKEDVSVPIKAVHSIASSYGGGSNKDLSISTIDDFKDKEVNYIVKDHDKVVLITESFEKARLKYNELN